MHCGTQHRDCCFYWGPSPLPLPPTAALSPKSLTQVPGPPTRPQQLGPYPQCPAPCPGPAHVHSLGLGCSSTSVCLKIFSVQFLVLSARARRDAFPLRQRGLRLSAPAVRRRLPAGTAGTPLRPPRAVCPSEPGAPCRYCFPPCLFRI